MDDSNHGGSGHNLFHMFLGCGLILLAVLFLSTIDATRGSWFVLIVLILCPVTMVLMMRRMPGMSGSADSRRREDYEDHT